MEAMFIPFTYLMYFWVLHVSHDHQEAGSLHLGKQSYMLALNLATAASHIVSVQ